MSFELWFFHDLLYKQLLKPGPCTISFAPGDYKQLLENIRMQTDSVSSRFVERKYETSDDAQIASNMRKHQKDLVQMADDLQGLLDEEAINTIYTISKHPSRVNLCKVLYKSLEELLFVIEKRCEDYFDTTKALPLVYRRIAGRELRNRLDGALAGLRELEVDKLLIKAVEKPFIDFETSSEVHCISRYKLEYLRMLLNVLERIPTRGEGEPQKPTVRLIRKLFFLNLNSGGFFDYYKERCKAELNELPTAALKLQHLQWLQDTVKQSHPREGYALYSIQTPIVAWIKDWLERESHKVESGAKDEEDVTVGAEDRLPTGLSAGRLAYLFRLMVDVGAFIPTSVIALMVFLSRFFTSSKNEHLSPESLRKKYYNPEPGSVKATEDMLHKMLEHSRKLRMMEAEQ